MLKNYWDKDGKSRALLYMGKSFSYDTMFSSIDDAAERLATVLQEGDVATICMPNTPECVYCFYALNKLGVIAHMVHPLAPVAQLKKFMTAAKSKLLITLSINLDKYSEIAKTTPIISIHPARSLPGIMRFFFNLKNKPYNGDMTNITPFDKLGKKHVEYAPKADDTITSVYLHSGGTGGEPKIIELSDHAINSLASRGLEALCTDKATGMYMLAALPMFHGFGLAMGIHAILSHGGVSVLMPKFDPKTTVKLLSKNRMHFIIGVPNLFRALLKRPEFNGDILKNLYVGFVGGDCAPQDLMDEFNARMEAAGATARLYEGYGLTETVTVCAVNNFKYNRRTSMGHMLSNLDAIIVEPGTTEPLPSGEKGEIAVAGDTQMNGYLNNEQANAEVFFMHDGKRYVRSGDFGYKDEDDYLYFVQRLKRIIKISGISVYPKEIESSALDLDGVTGACAVEYKAGGKTRIALFLTGKVHDAAEVKNKIESDLSHYAVPTIVEYIDEIPMTPVMKADTITLSARAEELSRGKGVGA